MAFQDLRILYRPVRFLSNLNYDQKCRHRLVGDKIPGDAGSVLDVGGRSADWLFVAGGGKFPAAFVVIVNRDIGHIKRMGSLRGGRVVADGCFLPFGNRAFDFAASIDTLEHVPPEFRIDLVEEMCRVVRSRVVLHCPASRTSRLFDRILIKLCRSSRIREITREHLSHAPVSLKELKSRFPNARISGTINAAVWLGDMLLRTAAMPERMTEIATALWALLTLPIRRLPLYYSRLIELGNDD